VADVDNFQIFTSPELVLQLIDYRWLGSCLTDTYLTLLDEVGAVVAEDDDSGNGYLRDRSDLNPLDVLCIGE